MENDAASTAIIPIWKEKRNRLWSSSSGKESFYFNNMAVKPNLLSMPDFASFSVFYLSIDGDLAIFNDIFCIPTGRAQA